jgi:hemerythrin-like domain-containing protein
MTTRAPQRFKPIAANTAGRRTPRLRASPPDAATNASAAAAIRTLKDEHLAIASVLFGLQSTVARARAAGAKPDFALLRALLDYVVAFPERLHHPKESRYLFAALARRSAQATGLIDELDAEHARGARLIDDLRVLLDAFQRDSGKLDAFALAVDDYAQFHWRHMEKEEGVLLPLARKHLAAADWERINAAFRDNDNPLRGLRPKAEIDTLFQRILALMPRASASSIAPSSSNSRRERPR